MTQFANFTANSERFYGYYLIAPATGSNNVVVSISSARDIRSLSVSYTGAKQSGQPDASTTNNNGVSGITTNLTTIADNCWMISWDHSSSGAVPAAGTGITSRNSLAACERIGDSNGAITPAGSYSMQWTGATGNGVIQVSIAGTAAAPSGNSQVAYNGMLLGV